MEGQDTFSVHDIPMTNARAAIVTKTADVYRESGNPTTRSIKGKEYVAWGEDDQLPYRIIDLIESDETLATCQMFNAEVCYGSGLRYCTEGAGEAVKSEVEDFLFDNPLPDYYLGVCQDLMYSCTAPRPAVG